jgi:CubicO group peptidase (beta-lactamase class C family)
MRVILLLCAACGAATPHSATDDLVGLWGAEVVVTQQTSGQLELRGHDDAWTATIAGISAPLQRDGDWLRADLGTGEVRFRPDRREAFWLQGGGKIVDTAYATPLALHVGDTITAEVTPLPDRVELYLDVTSPTTAFIREPGHNLGHFFGALAITRTGSTLSFTGKRGKVVAHGTLGPHGLHLAFDGADVELDLTRRGRGDAPGFYPRADTAYTEHVPVAGDGWDTASLASVRMRAEPIQTWVRNVLAAVPTSAESPAIHALVIARHGKLVVEEYFDGYTADTPHDTRSSGKSWGTTLVGIHIDRGELALTTPVDPARPITLEHVVSMTTGLDCDDHADDNPGNEDVMQAQHAERDWYRYTLALKSVRAPGERGVYCTGGINLGGYLLGRATHAWIPALFVDDLAEPLGLSHYYLNLMPTEEGYLGGGIQLRPRDFAKLAQLFLDHGQWHGKQIVSADWVTRATAAHASLNKPDDYGYGWWRTTYHVAGHDYAAFYASGNGGQLAIAIPELDVVVAIMSGNYGDFGTWQHFVDDDVPRYVIAAIIPERSR